MTKNKIVQTVGRDSLGSFAPEFAHYNDDIETSNEWLEPVSDIEYNKLK